MFEMKKPSLKYVLINQHSSNKRTGINFHWFPEKRIFKVYVSGE